MAKLNLTDLLKYIDPSVCSYQEWVEVGMALKEEGYTASDWDQWSAKDSVRYKPGEVYSKWDSFQDTGITGATITKMAKAGGWCSSSESNTNSHALDWSSSINDDLKIVDESWLETKEIYEPTNWKPKEQLVQYLNALFDSNDYIGYVTETYDSSNGKPLPTAGIYAKTAGQLIEELNRYDDISYAIGDYREEAGAWIRFNPLDGKGVKNANVTDYRFALVESDETDVGKQNALLRELELPIAMLVYSGGKSLHAIVRVDANSLPQYKERVEYIYNVCDKNGLVVDRQNKNPSRLSRMPGIIRNGHKQFIVDQNIGKATYDEWKEWIEEVNDDLPDPESLSNVWNNMPEKSPELIKGILRQGHKMLLAGQSKAGKSFALIELVIAIAEGKKWLGWECAQGKVLYVNLELDEPSAYHRFKDVYEALDYPPKNLNNIEIWNLRGKTAPMDKLAPKLIRRAEKRNYIAVIIDPIYKVLTGDENSAEDMANFTNQFDKIATALNCAVIYCHHHSKGAQGGKQSMDRASGSGVFARDPDAILDLIELNVSEGAINVLADKATISVYRKWLCNKANDYFDAFVSRDDLESVNAMYDHVKKKLPMDAQKITAEGMDAAQAIKDHITAWRIECTLREFAKPKPRNMWFQYPTHKVDDTGLLRNAKPNEEKSPWAKKGSEAYKKKSESRKKERLEVLEEGFEAVQKNGKADLNELSESIGKSERTVRNYVKKHPDFDLQKGFVVEKQ